MSTADAASPTFSAFCSRHAGEYVAPGTVQVSATVLVFRPDPSLQDPVVTFLLSEVTALRRDRAQSEIQIVVGKRKLRLRLLPALADRLWEVLQQRCKGSQVSEIGLMAEAVHVTGAVALEINAVLTVSGTVTVTSGGIAFEPGGDARLLGQKPFHYTFSEILGIDRVDLNRRVILRTPGRTVVLRGSGAQRAWLALTVVSDVLAAGGTVAPIVQSATADGVADQDGIFAIGARGFGFGGDPRITGGVQSFWTDLATFRSLRATPNGMELATADRKVTLSGEITEAIVRHLPERWLNAMGPVEREEGQWATRGVLHHEGAMEAGVLALEADALRFRAASGLRVVVATRGVPAKVSVDENDPRILRINGDGVETRLTTVNASAQVRGLVGIFSSTTWASPEAGLQPHALDGDDLAKITGLSAYARLLFHDEILSHAPDAMLAPEAPQVRLTMGFPKEPAAVPFPCLLEVVNGRGRFLVPGTVITAQPTGGRLGKGQERRFAVVFRFAGGVRLANRRAFFRLPLREGIPHLEGLTPEGTPLLLDDATMVNLSRDGIAFVTTSSVPVGTVLTFTSLLEGEVPITLSATVMHAGAVDRQTWRVGAGFTEESEEDRAKLYHDRELAFLRRRRRED